jgi:hypothetical protein
MALRTASLSWSGAAPTSKGVGTAAIQVLVEEARARGDTFIELEVIEQTQSRRVEPSGWIRDDEAACRVGVRVNFALSDVDEGKATRLLNALLTKYPGKKGVAAPLWPVEYSEKLEKSLVSRSEIPAYLR